MRILSFLLAFSMLLSLFAACGNVEDAETSGDETQTQTQEPVTAAPVQEPSGLPKVNIRIAQYGATIDDPVGMANDPIKKYIEDKLNITLEYDTGTDDFNERMRTELATGSAPDLFHSWGQGEIISDWINQDAILCLSDIVEANPGRYPILSRLFQDRTYKDFNKLYSGNEDKVYAIYSIAARPEPAFPGIPLYNTAILNEVFGGKTPATVEEFMEFGAAAGAAGYAGWWPRNDKLMNWNEISQTMARSQGTSLQPPAGDAWTGFMHSGTLGTNETWKLMTVSDKSREVMKQLASMYASNGLHQGVGERGDFDDAYAEFGMGKIGAVNFGFGHPGQVRDFFNSCWLAANPGGQLTDLTPGLALKSGNDYGNFYDIGMWVGAHFFIPYHCENPERVLDLVEYLASNEGQALLHKGIEGLTYEGREDPSVYFVDEWAKINGAYGYPDPDRAKYIWLTFLFSTMGYRVNFEDASVGWWDAVLSPYDNSGDWEDAERAAQAQYARDVIATYIDDVVTRLPGYYAVLIMPPEANDIKSALSEISARYLAPMLGGQMDIDTEWPNYVAEYEAAGALELERMFNEAVAVARGS